VTHRQIDAVQDVALAVVRLQIRYVQHQAATAG
jgi:hypothetical protein